MIAVLLWPLVPIHTYQNNGNQKKLVMLRICDRNKFTCNARLCGWQSIVTAKKKKINETWRYVKNYRHEPYLYWINGNAVRHHLNSVVMGIVVAVSFDQLVLNVQCLSLNRWKIMDERLWIWMRIWNVCCLFAGAISPLQHTVCGWMRCSDDKLQCI